MKNINSSSKTETRLGQAAKPLPIFISGIVAGSIITVYGTLTNVNLFKYIGSNSQDIVAFYRDLLGISRNDIPSDQGLTSYFSQLNIRVDPTDFKVNALPSSICDQVIREGDRIQVQTPPESNQEASQSKMIENKIQTIIEEGVGTLQVQSIEDEQVLIEIDLLAEEPSCRRKIPKIQQLETFLKEKKWQSADQVTYDILLDLANRVTEKKLDRNAIQTLNCSDLKTIDHLWVENSGGRFGLNIQQEIYTEIGNSVDEDLIKKYDPNLYIQFSDFVRWIHTQEEGQETWKSNDQLIYSLEAPKGHLPRINRLEDGVEEESGYQIISPNSLKVTSQEMEARNLFYGRIQACEL
ncbi:MAG: GUN4 domain-containing protein [Microcoleaceae cyanobacterium]